MERHSDDPREKRDQHYDRVNSFKEQTRKEVDAKREELAQLKGKRQELRLAAATTAGAIGLRYLAESNSYVRLVGTIDEEIVLPEVVTRPDPLPPDVPAPTAKEEAKKHPAPDYKPLHSKWAWLGELFIWLLVPVPGFFVGVGLLTIAGFGWSANPWVFWVGPILGFSVIAGLKVLLCQLWRIVAHAQAVGSPVALRATIASLVTLGACGLDAHLGAMALRQYILDRSFRASDVPPYAQLFFLALAITCPILLASAALTYIKALREPSREEREQARIDREQNRLEAERLAKIAQDEAERKRHRDALGAKVDGEYLDKKSLEDKRFAARQELDKQREEDWERLKNNAEYKCLQGLIGQIDVLTYEIGEKEKELTSYRISRGYEKAGEFPNGSAPEKAEVEPKQEPEQKDGPYTS